MELKWGFVGAGRIAHRLMKDLLKYPEARPNAVYARSMDKAEAFAERYSMPFAFDDMDAFLSSGEVELAYIALPHPLHEAFACRCLEKGIPVLCEKPMAPNEQQQRRMVECARKNDTFLMEAMWTRTFPITKQVKRWIDEGRIGEVVGMTGTQCIKAPDCDEDRLYRLSDAGGALLDLAVYPISYAHMAFGCPPESVTALSGMRSTGADDSTGLVLKFPGGKICTIYVTFLSEGRDEVTIYGRDGIIEIFENAWSPRHAKLTYKDGIIDFVCPEAPEDISVYGNAISFAGEGYQFEAAHVHDCIEKGLKESPLVPLDESLEIIHTCDEVRRCIGLRYPFE